MIDMLLAALGSGGMPGGFDISSVLGGKTTGAAPGGAPAVPGAAPAPMTTGGQPSGAIPQAPPMMAPTTAMRPAPDMSALMQAINNRPKLGI